MNNYCEAWLFFSYHAMKILATNLRSGALRLTLTPDLLEKTPDKDLFALSDRQYSDGSAAKARQSVAPYVTSSTGLTELNVI